MRLFFYCHEHSTYPDYELRPQVGIFWQWFNGSSKKYLERRNRYRVKSGFAEILDEGCYFTAELWIGNYKLGLNWKIRHPKHASLGRPF